MIRLEKLTKVFQQVRAVDEVSLQVGPGEIYGFLGPNGAGKTTTIKMLAGVLRPTSGRIFIDGLDLHTHAVEIKQRVGFIPDRPFLYERLTGMEFMSFMANLYGVNGPQQSERIERLLELFELAQWGGELVGSYSHGMKQRLIMSAALLHRPRVFIVDEPLVGLDPKGARLIKRIFRDLRSKNLTVFMSTHTLEIAGELCDRIGIIQKGKLVAEGTLAELKKRAGQKGPHLESIFLHLTGAEAESTEEIDFIQQ
ncbi:MAG: ABC transporter ATP-binding protein [Thermodesulfobacteriota bacterium]|nr:ABC transporter ATP-binding protein [Thermodesulfobacteriota bacterium]